MPALDPMKRFVRSLARGDYPLGRRDGRWLTLFKDFDLIPAATQAAGNDPDFDLTGTGTVPAPTFAAPVNGRGGIVLSTDTATPADNDDTRLFPLAASRWGQSVLPVTNNQSAIECAVRTGASVANTGLFFGLKLTDVQLVSSTEYSTDADQAMFVFDTDSAGTGASLTAWNAYVSVANTDTITPIGGASTSTGTVAAATEYLLRIEIDRGRILRFFINNGLRYTHTAALTASAALKITCGVITRDGTPAAKSHTIRQIRWSSYIA